MAAPKPAPDPVANAMAALVLGVRGDNAGAHAQLAFVPDAELRRAALTLAIAGGSLLRDLIDPTEAQAFVDEWVRKRATWFAAAGLATPTDEEATDATT